MVQAVVAAEAQEHHARPSSRHFFQSGQPVRSRVAALAEVRDRHSKLPAEQAGVIVAGRRAVAFSQTVTEGGPRTGGVRRVIDILWFTSAQPDHASRRNSD